MLIWCYNVPGQSPVTVRSIPLCTGPVRSDISAPARSLVIYGIYLLVLSVSIGAVPNLVLALLGIPSTGEIWVRVAAMLALLLAFYDIQAGRHEIISFIVFIDHRTRGW